MWSQTLVVGVDGAAALSVAQLSVPQLQELAGMCREQSERLLGIASRALGELQVRAGGSVPGPDGRPESVHRWWRDLTCSTGSHAGAEVRTALGLRELPLIADAVVDGRLGVEQARLLTRLLGRIDLARVQASQSALLAVACGRDPHSLALFVRHLIATHCEPALEDEQQAARDARYLQLTDRHDGTVTGRFRLAAEDAEVVRTVLEPLARRCGTDDARSAGQRRADALVEVFDQAVRHGVLPDAGGQRPQLSYVLPAGWAAGRSLDEADAADGPLDVQAPDATCASAAWSGPQTRARIEALLCDARISRVLLDSVGQVTGLESLTDTVTPVQRRALAARDRHCVAPGCARPPAFCDAHHLQALEDGGATTLSNLVLLCRRHHVLWHRGRLTLPELRLTWHSGPTPDALAASRRGGAGPPGGLGGPGGPNGTGLSGLARPG